MNIDILNRAIGAIDDDLIEASEAMPEKAKLSPFARKPWMKWAVVAATFIVVVAGALVAINVTGAWQNSNFVPPNNGATENPGIVTPSDGGSENPGSVPGSEGTPAINDNSSTQSGGNSGSENHGGQSSTPDKPDGTQTPSTEEPVVVIEGDFMKDNMPAVTYRIAGESRTFVYQKSSVVKTSEAGDGKPTYSVIDRYADPAGAAISVNADSGDLMRYESGYVQEYYDIVLSEEEAIAVAIRVAVASDISLTGFENANSSVWCSENRYYVSLTVIEGNAEVCLNKSGGLLYLVVGGR